jgi:hypothetical protein
MSYLLCVIWLPAGKIAESCSSGYDKHSIRVRLWVFCVKYTISNPDVPDDPFDTYRSYRPITNIIGLSILVSFPSKHPRIRGCADLIPFIRG